LLQSIVDKHDPMVVGFNGGDKLYKYRSCLNNFKID